MCHTQLLHRVPQLAGRALGLPTSPQVTCTAPGRHEKLALLQRREARSSIDPLPKHMAAREEAALSARASSAPGSLQTPCWDSSLVTRAAPRQSGASCSVEWSWMPAAERWGEPRSRCCRAEPHRHQSLPGPEPSA